MRRAVSGLLVATLLFAVPAFANREDRAREKRRSAVRELAIFAQCVVRNDERRVNAYLRMSPGSPEYGKAGQRLADGTCLSANIATLRMDPELMRWAFYDALYGWRFGKAAPTAPVTPAPLDFAAERDNMNEQQRQQYAFLRDFGDCVVRKDSATVHRILAAPTYSDAEKSAFGALSPVLGSCLPGNGNQTKFSRPSMRGILAEAAYKLRLVSTPVTPGG